MRGQLKFVSTVVGLIKEFDGLVLLSNYNKITTHHVTQLSMRNCLCVIQLFKRLFAEGLKVQKERMQTLRGYAREQREVRARKQQVVVESLEIYYKDQFSLLAESVAQERRNVEVRDAAQAEVR